MNERPDKLTRERLDWVANGEVGSQIDFDFANGALRSSKQVTKDGEDSFSIFHSVDGTWSSFTRKGIEEVMREERSPWDGDDDEDNEQEEDPTIVDDGRLKCPGCGWKYGHLFSLPYNGPEEAICFECWREIGPDPLDQRERDDYGLITYAQEPAGDATGWTAVENVGYPEQTAYTPNDNRGETS